MAEDKELKKSPVILAFLITIAFVASVWSCTWWWIEWQSNPTDSGSVGDSFGVVNALFSGLAFAGVIVAIFLQRAELHEATKQTRKLADESEIQSRHFKKQVESMAVDRFESTFFRMIGSLQDIAENMSAEHPIAGGGRRVFERMASAIDTGDYKRKINQGESFKPEHRTEVSKQYHQNCFRYCSKQVGHYFRLLYHIVKYVDENDTIKGMPRKRVYIRILRAHLSAGELKCILYNGLADDLGYPKFYTLIDKYDLLQNLPVHMLTNQSDHRFYPSMIKAELARRGAADSDGFDHLYSELQAGRYPGTSNVG